MIKQQTASDIWSAYREIEAAEGMLAKLKEEREKPFAERDKNAPTLKDAFGRQRHFEMGIPSGESGHRIYAVSPQLAESVLLAHIAKKKAELAEANERARLELSGDE